MGMLLKVSSGVVELLEHTECLDFLFVLLEEFLANVSYSRLEIPSADMQPNGII